MNEKTIAILKEIAEWVFCFIIAYILYVLINYFIGTISGVKQSSMYPTAIEGEKLLIQRPTIFKKDLQRGDIIVFEAPINQYVKSSNNTAVFNEYTGFKWFTYNILGIDKMTYVKRVIGLPGDRIDIDKEGRVKVNGEDIEENYVNAFGNTPGVVYTSLVVADNSIFVMGDNRPASKDSREFGCIPIEKVTGYVICRVWPFNRLGGLDK